jgi:acetyl esterase/lipase
MARALGVHAVSVDYRLAPEDPFPAGLDDAVRVIEEILNAGKRPDEIVVAGDSAGGGLATALLLRRRDESQAPVAGGILLSPWLDLTGTSKAMEEVGTLDPMLDPDGLRLAGRAYAGSDLRHPWASPIFADPQGLPPLLIFAGTLDILVDDSRHFADAAKSAGVDVEIHIEDGLMHVWPFVDGLPEAATSLDQMAQWCRRWWT